MKTWGGTALPPTVSGEFLGWMTRAVAAGQRQHRSTAPPLHPLPVVQETSEPDDGESEEESEDEGD